MHSYRRDVYASLVSQLFIKIYAEYYKVIIDSKITSYCDNKVYVERLKQFIDDPYMSRGFLSRPNKRSIKSSCKSKIRIFNYFMFVVIKMR